MIRMEENGKDDKRSDERKDTIVPIMETRWRKCGVTRVLLSKLQVANKEWLIRYLLNVLVFIVFDNMNLISLI